MNRILVTENGPLECSGAFELTNAEGVSLALEAQTCLCRCGRSGNKPYCDGSHERTSFADASLPHPAGVSDDQTGGTVQ